jgi:hypothetical protein
MMITDEFKESQDPPGGDNVPKSVVYIEVP